MDITDPIKETNPSISLISQVWEGTLTNTNFDLFNRRGFLTYELEKNLHVLTLNTVPYSVGCYLFLTTLLSVGWYVF